MKGSVFSVQVSDCSPQGEQREIERLTSIHLLTSVATRNLSDADDRHLNPDT